MSGEEERGGGGTGSSSEGEASMAEMREGRV